MEARLVPQAGYAFAPIEIMGFQRKLSWFNIRYNLRSIGCLMRSWKRARQIIRTFGPDVIVGTGGYVSGPVLREGSKLGVKTLTHESNAFPGVTTKLLARTADKVLISVEEARRFLPSGRDYIVSGNPVREQIIFADREKARARLGIGRPNLHSVVWRQPRRAPNQRGGRGFDGLGAGARRHLSHPRDRLL